MKIMVRLKFTGVEPELTIMTDGGRIPVLVKRGGECEVPDCDAKSLVARGDFEIVDPKGAKK